MSLLPIQGLFFSSEPVTNVRHDAVGRQSHASACTLPVHVEGCHRHMDAATHQNMYIVADRVFATVPMTIFLADLATHIQVKMLTIDAPKL